MIDLGPEAAATPAARDPRAQLARAVERLPDGLPDLLRAVLRGESGMTIESDFDQAEF
jgi:hypothetical protein